MMIWQCFLVVQKKGYKRAIYACVNHGEAFCPSEIEDRSMCIDGDIAKVLDEIK